MENQVLTIEQMQELKELCIDTSKASCTWCKVRAITSDRKGYSWMILPKTLNKFDEEYIPTFTLQDILKMLPEIDGDVPAIFGKSSFYGCGYFHDTEWEAGMRKEQYGSTPLEAAFNMLKWCKQNSYV